LVVVSNRRVARQIAESPYEGSVMLELAQRFHDLYHDMSTEDYYARAGLAAARLERQIRQYREAQNA
jgi:hypothetical protein